MKKAILSAVLSLASFAAIYAQPNLTAANSNPDSGDVFYGHYCDTSHSAPGTAGAGVTWDFSALNEVEKDTTIFTKCSATPYCDSFPGSNLAAANGGGYSYMYAGTSALSAIGSHYDTSFFHFTNPMDLLFYPAAKDSTHTGLSSEVYSFGGENIYSRTVTNFVCDAYGKLILPGATYTNALRIHQTMTTTDSLNIMGLPIVNSAQSESYNWFTPGFHNALLSISIDTSGNGGVPYVTSTEFFSKPVDHTNTSTLSALAGTLEVFPTPASDLINVKFRPDGNNPAILTITDLAGRVLDTKTLPAGVGTASCAVSDMPNGVYMLRISNGGTNAIRKFIVSK